MSSYSEESTWQGSSWRDSGEKTCKICDRKIALGSRVVFSYTSPRGLCHAKCANTGGKHHVVSSKEHQCCICKTMESVRGFEGVSIHYWVCEEHRRSLALVDDDYGSPRSLIIRETREACGYSPSGKPLFQEEDFEVDEPVSAPKLASIPKPAPAPKLASIPKPSAPTPIQVQPWQCAYVSGDRVRFSKYGIESLHPQQPERLGTIPVTPRLGDERIAVRWDGCVSKDRYAKAFLEKVEAV